MKHELDKNFWAIISATEVITMNKTYTQCETLLSKSPNDAYIVTNPVAQKMLQTIANRYKNDSQTKTSA